ncbi:hypothetical protein B7494_g3430 [Chlorociboria aeruginascens]|nr:hypothetical protein B7494_g3430 [Chlorociboria aeruginascens]
MAPPNRVPGPPALGRGSLLDESAIYNAGLLDLPVRRRSRSHTSTSDLRSRQGEVPAFQYLPDTAEVCLPIPNASSTSPLAEVATFSSSASLRYGSSRHNDVQID